MTFRDTSADVTLDNANEGIMSNVLESFRKEFAGEKTTFRDRQFYTYGSQSRQPEIDALKSENEFTLAANRGLGRLVDVLQAEISRLKADAERYRWLRDPCVDIRPIVKYARGDYGWGLMTGKMLDESIDAAMKDFSTRHQEEGWAVGGSTGLV